jgi:hypothetical protein
VKGIINKEINVPACLCWKVVIEFDAGAEEVSSAS